MIDIYDDILNDNYNDKNGFSFNMISTFRIVDNNNIFSIDFHKLFKRSYKGFYKEVDIIIKDNPINISNITNIELSNFKMNKLYKGFFHVNFYTDNTYDIFLKDYNIL